MTLARKPRVGDTVKAHSARGNDYYTGKIVRRETKGAFARAYGPRFILDNGASVGVHDVFEILPRGAPVKNPDDRLTMAHLDMNGNALAKNGGDHVELHPGLDLWMRGARYGTTRKISVDGIATVKMDHPGVKRLQRIPVGRLKLTTNRNPAKRGPTPRPLGGTYGAGAALRARSRREARKPRKVRRGNPRRSAPLSGFQVAALREGKILFLSGVAMTSNREAASSYSNVKTARHVANQVRNVGRKLGISKVAVVTKHDRPAEIHRFLLGGA